MLVVSPYKFFRGLYLNVKQQVNAIKDVDTYQKTTFAKVVAEKRKVKVAQEWYKNNII